MNVLYIGPNNAGSTSGMRAQTLKSLLASDCFYIIDTYEPFIQTHKIFRSVGFRYKIGPFIKNLNKYILNHKPDKFFDLIWIDKGSFITPTTLNILKPHCKKLVHYTPDTAFFQNRSRLFEAGMPFYDHFITTKSFDLHKYPKEKTLVISQGYDPEIHKPYYQFEEKSREVVFIGLYEPYRGRVIQELLNAGIRVAVAGKKWNRFSKIKHPFMEYLGEGLFGEEYAKVISSSYFGLGLLSKLFPELHTTRTFEIPACSTLLITEKNTETSKFFEEDEVLFFNEIEEIKFKIQDQIKKREMLKYKIEKGYQKVKKTDYSNQGILQRILWKLGY